MSRILLAFVLLLSHLAYAQSDKAQHAAVSAGLGLSIRAATDSKPAAFWSTVAIGAAKEAYDAQQAGNYFSGGDMVANIAGAALSTLGPAPDRVGVMGYTLHTTKTRHLSNITPGLVMSWHADWLPWERGAADAAVFRNSQGFPGAYLGASKEWRPLSRLYLGLGGGVTYGYRRYEHAFQLPGEPRPNGIRFGCLPDVVCIYEVATKPRWLPAALLSARVQLNGGYSLWLTYLPAGAVAKALNGNNGFLKDADAFSLWIGKQF